MSSTETSPEQPFKTIGDCLNFGVSILKNSGIETARLDCEVLLAEVLEKDRSWLLAHNNDCIDTTALMSFHSLLKRRREREPLAYITGRKSFMGHDFEVSSDVLIPRPETEHLVEACFQHLSAFSTIPTVIDIGCGSGCIVISLAYLCRRNSIPVQFYAVDISAGALEVAKRNVENILGLDHGIKFIESDILCGFSDQTRSFDLIVSNPPYISGSQIAVLQPEVSRYEPSLALDGGNDGLDVIRRIFEQSQELLTGTGIILLEIGQGQELDAINLGLQHGFKHSVTYSDLAGVSRVVEFKRDDQG